MTNSFAKRNFIQPMGRPNHALSMPWFFGCGGGERLEGRFFFQVVFGVESGLSMPTWTVDFPCKFFEG